MTPQEKHLWYDFLRSYPVQFRRQKQFGRFFVDFYCAAAALVLELDGAGHFTEQGRAYDRERTWYLESLGLKVIRYTNNSVDNQFEQTCKSIDAAVQKRIEELSQKAPHNTEEI